MTIEELMLENKKLKEENYRLKALLRKHNFSYEDNNSSSLSTAAKLWKY